MNFHLYKIIVMSVVIVMCIHWAACLQYYLSLVVAKVAGQSHDALVIEKFHLSIYILYHT